MISIFVTIFTIFCVGLSMGGLLISRNTFPEKPVIFSIGLMFSFFVFIGMFFGAMLPSFVTPYGVSILFTIFTLALFVNLIRNFDPTFGYIKREDKVIWGMIFFLFFMIGIEVAVLAISKWFVILFTIVFIASVILGGIVIFTIFSGLRRHPFFSLLPLMPLVFISLLKLL